MFYKAIFALFPIAAIAFCAPAQADCVGAKGQDRSGVVEKYCIDPKSTDFDRYVRTDLGPVTVQVDVKEAYNRKRTCGHENEKLSFTVHWTQRGAAYACLFPSERGPKSFLSCYFKVSKLGPGDLPGKWSW